MRFTALNFLSAVPRFSKTSVYFINKKDGLQKIGKTKKYLNLINYFLIYIIFIFLNYIKFYRQNIKIKSSNYKKVQIFKLFMQINLSKYVSFKHLIFILSHAWFANIVSFIFCFYLFNFF